MTQDAPLILTLAFEPDAQAAFEAARQRHFPPARNMIPAHVSLFHHLPGSELTAITARLQAICRQTPLFPVQVDGLMSLGRGVAYRLRSDRLAQLRADLAASWTGWLTPQDRQGYRPHLTIQNKTTPDAARALQAQLAARFQPHTVQAAALRLWWYRGGPWDEAGTFGLHGADQTTGVL